MNRWISFNREDPASILSALEQLQGMYEHEKAHWNKERKALQKQACVHVQLRDARARVALLEGAIEEVQRWHGALYNGGGGYHSDLHDILLRVKRPCEEPP